MKHYYVLLRKEDEHVMAAAFFKSVTTHKDKEDAFTEFPPKAFDKIVVFNNIHNYYKTTEVQVVEQVNENEYDIITLTGSYNIKRIPIKQ